MKMISDKDIKVECKLPVSFVMRGGVAMDVREDRVQYALAAGAVPVEGALASAGAEPKSGRKRQPKQAEVEVQPGEGTTEAE